MVVKIFRPGKLKRFCTSTLRVQDVQIIGVPDRKFGEVVMAWVQLRKGRTASEDELKTFLQRADCVLQSPALLEVRRDLSHDRDRKDSEVQNAGDQH